MPIFKLRPSVFHAKIAPFIILISKIFKYEVLSRKIIKLISASAVTILYTVVIEICVEICLYFLGNSTYAKLNYTNEITSYVFILLVIWRIKKYRLQRIPR